MTHGPHAYRHQNAYIFNHVTIVLKYRPSDDDPSQKLIVAFEV